MFRTTALLGVGVSSGSISGRLVTISLTLVDVNLGNITITSLVDVTSLKTGVSMDDSGVFVTSCRVSVEVWSGNAIRTSVVIT